MTPSEIALRKALFILVGLMSTCIIILLMLIATPKEVFTRHIEIVIK